MGPSAGSAEFALGDAAVVRRSAERAALRRRMKGAGVRIRPPSFSRLIRRMANANYLHTETEQGPRGFRYVRPRQFVATDLGVAIWRQAREFYAAVEAPPVGFTAIETEECELAHLPKKKRRTLLRQRTKRHLKRIFENALGVEIKLRGNED